MPCPNPQILLQNREQEITALLKMRKLKCTKQISFQRQRNMFHFHQEMPACPPFFQTHLNCLVIQKTNLPQLYKTRSGQACVVLLLVAWTRNGKYSDTTNFYLSPYIWNAYRICMIFIIFTSLITTWTTSLCHSQKTYGPFISRQASTTKIYLTSPWKTKANRRKSGYKKLFIMTCRHTVIFFYLSFFSFIFTVSLSTRYLYIHDPMLIYF